MARLWNQWRNNPKQVRKCPQTETIATSNGNTGNVTNHTRIVTLGTKVSMVTAQTMVTTLPR